ncbi:MAG: long-chain fatty acid--CoA ligase [Prevotellaceae bacterium]|nr:long-chain fatty acid--CoA ligase [Prevotellaceae bacterium]MDD5991881.1 long-chain fatty acid--CoA ligase [Prevotellaceae bacterium]MDD6111648.1 long-chain fatty acid--CoA ligase [Prevotellaceae bacterium]MDD6781231.1 long-chain fatty acid--CoA ligase [Prevotellaceae bacterium]
MQTNSHLSVLVHDQAKNYADREAMIYQDFGCEQWKSYSWNEFSSRVRTVSNAMLNLGVKVQENVGVFSQNCPQYLFCDYGAWGIRAVTVPFYATSSEQQIQFIINDAKIRFLFVGEQEQYEKAHRVMALCPTLERIIVFDRSVTLSPRDPNALYFDDFLKLGDGFPRQTEVEKCAREATFDDLANILYTSGTTGESKGVMLTHGQYHAALEANGKCVNIHDDDRVLNFLPFAHIFEKAWAVLAVTVGATLIVNNDPKRVQQSMRDTNPTCMSAVPRFWEKVYAGVMEKIEKAGSLQQRIFSNALAVGRKYNIEYLSRGKRPPLTLRLKYDVINKALFGKVRKELGLVNANIFPTAGAAISAHVEEFVHSIGINMIAGYGLTESLATVSCDRLGEPYSVGSVGRIIDGLDVKISEEGEVLLKGPSIFHGYYNRDDITAASFTEDGYFKTGDAGYIKDGELFLTERIKDLFKTSNGKYIAPQMIETRLLVDKYIDQIAVIADERKFVSALIVPEYRLLEEYAKANGIEYGSMEELCADKRINEMIKERIDTLQQQLAYYEQVKRFTILPKPFTMENGELTNTLKLKRRVVNENYKAAIDKMYEE